MIFKKGSTFKCILEFEADEWESFHPFESVECQIKSKTNIYTLQVVSDESAMTILVMGDSTDWASGSYVFDVMVRKNGEKIYLPSDTNMTFQIINPITGAAQ